MNSFRKFFRTLRRNKTATLLNIIGLSAAFASFILIMTQVRYELSFDRHYKTADRIFRLEKTTSSSVGLYEPLFNRDLGENLIVSSPDIEQSGMFTSDANTSVYDAVKGEQTVIENNYLYEATPGFFDIFEFECTAGSFERFREPGTVVLSQSTATALYGKENPTGHRIVLNREQETPFEIVGVYRDFPKNSSVRNGIVTNIGDKYIDRENEWGMTYFIRANRPENAEKICRAMQAKCDELYGDYAYEQDIRLRLSPIADVHFSRDVFQDEVEKGNRTTVFSLLCIAVLIIVIAMVNLINFAVSTVPLRIRYLNTRKVLGESNVSIRWNLIGESAGLALISYVVAVLLVEYLSGTPMAGWISDEIAFADNFPITLGTGAIALAAAGIAGIYPAFYSTSFSPAMALKGSFGLSHRGRHLRLSLISFQYTVSLILIIASLSIAVQNRFMRHYDMGFDKANILTTYVTDKIAERPRAFTDRLKKHPAIEDVAYANSAFVSNAKSQWTLTYSGTGEQISYNYYNVSTNFLSFMGLKIIDGRDFTETDDNPYIFNRTAQQKYDLKPGGSLTENENEIIGIVEDFNFKPMHYSIDPIGLQSGGEPNYPLNYTLIKVNTADVGPVIAYIRRTMQEFDPTAREDVVFLDESIGNLYRKEETLSKQIALFSLLSILISVAGVFGTVLFETQYRRKEIGLRKIHGATIGEILRMFNRTYIRIVLACFVVAAPAAYLIIRKWLENFTYKMPFPIWVFPAALLIVLAVTVFTISLQTYITAVQNPLKSIRTE